MALAAVTCPVKNDAQHRLVKAVLGQHRSGVGMVMLDPGAGPSKAKGVAGAEVVGVEVAGDPLRFGFEHCLEVVDAFEKEVVAFRPGELADMLADIGLPGCGRCRRRFSFRRRRQECLQVGWRRRTGTGE